MASYINCRINMFVMRQQHVDSVITNICVTTSIFLITANLDAKKNSRSDLCHGVDNPADRGQSAHPT